MFNKAKKEEKKDKKDKSLLRYPQKRWQFKNKILTSRWNNSWSNRKRKDFLPLRLSFYRIIIDDVF